MEKLKFFGMLSKRFIISENEEKEKLFHNEIEKDKDLILNCYRKEPFYKDTIDKMELKSRGNFYYKSLVKNQIKKRSNFVKIILQSISAIKDRPKYKIKKRDKRYNIPQLELIKDRKNKVDSRLKMKDKENNIFRSFQNYKRGFNFSLKKNNLSNNKYSSLDSKRIFSGVTKDIESNTTLKNNNLSHSLSMNTILTSKNNDINYLNKEERIDKFNKILNECKKEIENGDKIGGNMEKFTERFNKNLSKEKEIRENKVDNNIQDQKIVEDKINPRHKYKLLEIEKFKDLKRRLNAKISDNYIFFNRKQYSEFVNDKRKEEEYELYYEDVNKEHETVVQNRMKEKTKFNEIKNMLEDSYKRKDFIKNKIEFYNQNRLIQSEKELKEKNNFELLIKEEEKKDKENFGTLLPKLLLKKKEVTKKKKKCFEDMIDSL